MAKQHYELFLHTLELNQQITELLLEQAELQQQITAQHLEQEYRRFINSSWLPKEQQKLVNKAVAVRAKILTERNQERRKELVAQFNLLEQQIEEENLLDDYLCGWKLAELGKK